MVARLDLLQPLVERYRHATNELLRAALARRHRAQTGVEPEAHEAFRQRLMDLTAEPRTEQTVAGLAEWVRQHVHSNGSGSEVCNRFSS